MKTDGLNRSEQALVLHEAGVSYDGIAAQMNVEPHTVRGMVSVAKKKRAELEKRREAEHEVREPESIPEPASMNSIDTCIP